MSRQGSLKLILLCAALGARPGLAGPSPEKVIGLSDLQTWTGAPGELRARSLSVVEFACSQEARRILIEAPGQRRVVLDYLIQPSAGLSWYRLLDDATGWWVELRELSPIRIAPRDRHTFGSSLFWQRAMAAGGGAEPRDSPVVYGLDTSRGHLASLATSTWNDGAMSDLLDVLAERGDARRLTTEMPPDLREAILFLRSLTAGEAVGGGYMSHSYRLLEVLGQVVSKDDVPLHRAYDGVTWHETSVKNVGTTVENEDALALAAVFRSIRDGRDPLQELHAADPGCPD